MSDLGDPDARSWSQLCVAVLDELGTGLLACDDGGVLRAATPLGLELLARVGDGHRVAPGAPVPPRVRQLVRDHDGGRVTRARLPCDGGAALRVTVGTGAPVTTYAITLRLERDREADALASLRGRFKLTPRDLQMIARIARGQSNHTIADALGLSHGTVKNYVHRVYEVLGVRSRTELMALIERMRAGE